MIPFLAFGAALIVGIWWFRKRRKESELHPLASFDSGVRSPFRTPGRRFKHKRGF